MRRRLPDLLIAGLFFLLPLVMFWQQTIGGQTLLPTENLYQFEPYATYRERVQAPEVPHNHLVSDLVLQNMQWKSFIRESIAQREIPLWNPHQFAGIPFMAAGQQSTLYPLSVLYYVLPLPVAYGWFTVFNLWLAGLFMFAFLRGLGAARVGALISGVTYQLCGFFIASAVFPMFIGAVVWLPLLLLMAEFIIRRQPLFGRPSSVPWVVVGAVALGCNLLAGHIEITIYTLLILAFYAAARLVWTLWERRTGTDVGPIRESPLPDTLKSAGWLAAMVALGFGLGGVQFIPLFEFVQTNWRAERSSLETVLSLAHPARDVIQFVMPNFYGNPAHHSYFDIFTMERVTSFTNAAGDPINFIDWGIKNYVEGALYVGILPLALAAFALVDAFTRSRHSLSLRRQYVVIMALLAVISLTFMFGLPTYAALYALPGINQLNTAFRWVFGVTVGVAVLAGFGADALHRLYQSNVGATRESPSHESSPSDANATWARRFGYGLVIVGVLILGGLLVSRVLYSQIEPLLERLLNSMVNASGAFSGPRMFYSYEFINALIFGLMALGSGVVFLLAASRVATRHAVSPPPAPLQRFWQIAAVALVAVDLLIASWGFNPASDPLLLDFTPPSIQWLIDHYEEEGPFRYAVLQDPDQRKVLVANMTMRYGLDDIHGYESIIPRQYVDYMRRLAPQNQLDFNRIAPIYTQYHESLNFEPADALMSPRLALLNVRYIVSNKSVDINDYLPPARDVRTGDPLPPMQPVYEDEAVRIWRAPTIDLPRAYISQLIDGGRPTIEDGQFTGWDVVIDRDTGREKVLHANLSPNIDAWLIVSETYMPGWRAFVRPRAGDDDTEQPVEVERVLENFQGMNLSPDVLQSTFADIYDDLPQADQNALDNGQVTVRMVYSPTSFQVGMFTSVISGALVAFLLGVWLWRLLIVPDEEGEGSAVSRVARNSVAPIILNLFNRGIDFAFAFVMLRILGPADAGIYFYAVVVFVWFDIFTNFGLDVFVIREVSRHREQSGYYLLNTSTLRLFLMLACVPLLLGFLLVRQSAIDPALSSEALLAIGLLYIGLAPSSLSKGLTSLFYAFERAEYPAAVTTITTINKAALGLIVLLLGYGIVGLAAVSIVVNFVTLGILLWRGRRLIGAIPNLRPDRGLIRSMMGESWPLMLNHLLATIFFQIDIVILEAVRTATIVGQYSVSYKWLLALNIIPAFFTQALLPVMSRQAREDRDALRRSYTLAIKLLVSIALPLAVWFTFLAETLTLVLGGPKYLPAGAIALQIMIWSIPIGWMNSLTQYALIAVDLQRRITTAFIIAVTFNIVSNIILIPIYGYRAAAVTTIFSEMVLLIPFGLLLQGALGKLAWGEMVWRQVVAGGAMLAVMLASWPVQPLLALALSAPVYIGVLLVLRPLSSEERDMLLPLLPARLKRLAEREVVA